MHLTSSFDDYCFEYLGLFNFLPNPQEQVFLHLTLLFELKLDRWNGIEKMCHLQLCCEWFWTYWRIPLSKGVP